MLKNFREERGGIHMFMALLDTGAQVHLVPYGEGELSTRMAQRAGGAEQWYQ